MLKVIGSSKERHANAKQVRQIIPILRHVNNSQTANVSSGKQVIFLRFHPPPPPPPLTECLVTL